MQATSPHTAATPPAGPNPAPLCVDLDGTLLRSDVLAEGVIALLRKSPLFLFRMLGWLCRGKAHLKQQVARRSLLDVASLPYNNALLELLAMEKSCGRRLVLATGADEEVAHSIAAQLLLFDEVLASHNGVNLTGLNKRDALKTRYGHFGYAGNSGDDVAVWRESNEAICVDCSPRFARGLQREQVPVRELRSPRKPAWRIWMRVLRVHQWSKNLLLLVPVLTAHAWGNPHVVLAAVLGVCAFHLLASSAYVVNDLVDLDADRRHPTKRLRPFASGALSPLAGLWLTPLLMAGGMALASTVSWKFLEAAVVYLAATLAYSLWLKREVLLDVMVLAGLYTWRVLAGAVAAPVILSPWLLGFSIFIFLSLALVKRCIELRRGADDAGGGERRGYTPRDYEQLARLGAASSYVAVLIMALYISSAETVRLYPRPMYLWGICPVLIYWLSRMWMLTDRGTMNDDPVLFALGDRASYISAAIILAFLASAMRLS